MIMKLTRRSVFGATCLCASCLLPGSLLATAPMVKRQAPGFYRLLIGDFEVTVLSDGTNMLPAMKLLQGDPARIAEALKRNFLGELVETAHNWFLVNTGSKLVSIDAGAGTMLGPNVGDLLNNLHAAGYQPEQVDEIYLTHMHTDHIGGLVASRQRAFPNAIVRVNKRDTDYWLSEASMRAAPAETERFFQAATVSMAPYIQAGKLRLFEGDTDLVAAQCHPQDDPDREAGAGGAVRPDGPRRQAPRGKHRIGCQDHPSPAGARPADRQLQARSGVAADLRPAWCSTRPAWSTCR